VGETQLWGGFRKTYQTFEVNSLKPLQGPEFARFWEKEATRELKNKWGATSLRGLVGGGGGVGGFGGGVWEGDAQRNVGEIGA